ncbi:MAG: carboxymuconolactone decarboxylase family protein [Sphingomonadales bacterium]|nr:MAG: carboxymuconolactone decarboxylase family protein [Sphingomonadales bacterium]
MMPVIAPLPMEALDEECRARIRAGQATGMYSQTLPLQVMARAPAALRAMDEGYKAMFRRALLDDRLRELLRVRSALLNGCGPCSQSRKEDSVNEADVMCLADPEAATYTRRERLALKYLTQFCTDHYAITPATYIELAEEFSAAEIVELGWTCAQTSSGHRFMHTLDMLGDGEPVIG